MSLIKAVLLGGLLTWLVSLVLGTNHANTGWLNVHHMTVASHQVYWSWPLFVAATGMVWAILTMMPSDR
ncbi:MAG TPA: hypothetical protein VL100_03155 [Croceibacterium sp.]|nr:hypothetical protein [Croceibacterium sp.]